MDNLYKDWSQDEIDEEEVREAEMCGLSFEEYENLDPESWSYIQSHNSFNEYED